MYLISYLKNTQIEFLKIGNYLKSLRNVWYTPVYACPILANVLGGKFENVVYTPLVCLSVLGHMGFVGYSNKFHSGFSVWEEEAVKRKTPRKKHLDGIYL